LRIAIRDLPVDTDPTAGFDITTGSIAGAFADERDTWGIDLCVVRLPPAMAERHRLNAIDLLAGPIRAEAQLGGSAPELVASWWADALPTREAAPQEAVR
jgi:hypothetical protein